MMSSLSEFASLIASLLLTYLLHSTAALGCVFLVSRFRLNPSLSESLWKYAAVVALVTAPAQIYLARRSTTEPSDSAISSFSVESHAEDQSDQRSAAKVHVLPATTADAHGKERPIVLPAAENLVLNAAPLSEGAAPSEIALQPAEICFASEPDNTVLAPTASEGTQRPSASSEAPIRFDRDVIDPGLETGTSEHDSGNQWLALTGLILAPLPLFSLGVGMTLILLRAIAFHRRLHSAAPIENGLAQRELAVLLTSCGIRRRVRLLRTSEYPEPIAYGLVRWTIVLPAGIEKRLSQAELRALLAHELAHLVRGDVAWLWIGQALCLCLPFQPLNYVARRQWGRAAEFLCDRWAVQAGVSGLTLARCLTEIAEWKIERRCRVSLAASGRETTVARVQQLVNAKHASKAPPSVLARVVFRAMQFVVLGAMVSIAPKVAVPVMIDDRATLETPESDVRFAGAVNDKRAGLDTEFEALEADLRRLDGLLRERTQMRPEMRAAAERILRRSVSIRQQREDLKSAR